MQQLSQLGRSTTTDPIEHISEEKSLLKIIAKICLTSLTSYWLMKGVAVGSYGGGGGVLARAVSAW